MKRLSGSTLLALAFCIVCLVASYMQNLIWLELGFAFLSGILIGRGDKDSE